MRLFLHLVDDMIRKKTREPVTRLLALECALRDGPCKPCMTVLMFGIGWVLLVDGRL